MRIRERFVRWYFRRVIGRCCPCEWPIKSRTLIRWCGRMDDAYDRLVFIDFARHYMAQATGHAPSGQSSDAGVCARSGSWP